MFALRSPRLIASLPMLVLALAAACPSPASRDAQPPLDSSLVNEPDSKMPTPPRAEKRPFTVESPNGDRSDDYYWLRDDARQDPDVLAYLAAENAYCDEVLVPTVEHRKALYAEIIERLEQVDSSKTTRACTPSIAAITTARATKRGKSTPST